MREEKEGWVQRELKRAEKLKENREKNKDTLEEVRAQAEEREVCRIGVCVAN